MYDFLVLGQIPGTNHEITFFAWQTVALLIVLAFAMRYLRRNRNLAYEPITRQPLHASQLHQRAL